ncbi:MAG: hypothetical protein ABR500_00075 [Dermatophilaceae bacterium]|nr:hypothetical protein [Intrasporangiaceae bacterium]
MLSVPRRTLENRAPEVREVFETAKALDREQIADLAYQLLRILADDSSPVDQDKVDAAEPVLRIRSVKTFRYRIVYDIRDETVRVIAYTQTSREPGYWHASTRT